MHYIFAYKKAPGCPSFINGVLHERYFSGAYDDSMSYDWDFSEPGIELADLPAKLFLVTADKKFSFDFATSFSGHIVSERFMSVFKHLTKTEWQVAALEIWSPAGKRLHTEMAYYFIKQKDTKHEKAAIDLERSHIEYRKTGEIKSIRSLVIRDHISLDFFVTNEITLARCIILSEQAATDYGKLELSGVELVSTTAIGTITPA